MSRAIAMENDPSVGVKGWGFFLGLDGSPSHAESRADAIYIYSNPVGGEVIADCIQILVITNFAIIGPFFPRF